jgi:hypothetical protein
MDLKIIDLKKENGLGRVPNQFPTYTPPTSSGQSPGGLPVFTPVEGEPGRPVYANPVIVPPRNAINPVSTNPVVVPTPPVYTGPPRMLPFEPISKPIKSPVTGGPKPIQTPIKQPMPNPVPAPNNPQIPIIVNPEDSEEGETFLNRKFDLGGLKLNSFQLFGGLLVTSFVAYKGYEALKKK